MPHNSLNAIYNNTYKKLIRVTRQFFSLKSLRYLIVYLIYFLITLLVFSFLELLFNLSQPVRLGFWIISALLLIYFLVRYGYPNAGKFLIPQKKDLFKISKLIGRGNPEVSDSLIDFLQIYYNEDEHNHPIFKSLSMKQLYMKFKDVDFRNILSLKTLFKPVRRFLILCSVFVIFFLMFPQSMGKAVQRVLFPNNQNEYSSLFIIKNVSGNLIVLKNESVILQGVYERIRPHKLWVIIKPFADSSITEKFEIPFSSKNTFEYEIKHVKKNFQYWFEANFINELLKENSKQSELGNVTVKERPYIRNLQIKLQYPAYTNLPTQLLPPNQGEIHELIGTNVSLEIEVNKLLSEAKIRFQDSSIVFLNIIENRATGKFIITKNDKYHILINDMDGVSNYQPVQYSIFTSVDEKPFVEITKPGQDLDLGDELSIPLLINLRDDYGFSRLSLKGRVIHAGSNGDTTHFSNKLPIQFLEKGKAISEPLWDLSPLYLIPQDYIEYYAEVADNDRISGPKIAMSKTYVLRLPSIMELIEETNEFMTEQLEETETLKQDSKELREKLKEINREMKKEKELSWERKNELQEQVQQHEQLLNKLDNIRENLEKIINQLDDQKTLSPETLEKYFELQNMLQDLLTPEMLEVMNKLKEALKKADLEEIKKSLNEFQLSVEDFEKNIDRTYELFKRIELERQMDELVKMAEKITEEQKEINENIKKNPELNNEQLAKKEDNLGKQTEFLKDKIQETQKNYLDVNSVESDELKKAQEYIDEKQIPGEIQKMKQQLTAGQMNKAQQQGNKLQQQMETLQNMLKQGKQNMGEMQKEEMMEAMTKVTQDMLETSFQQENLFTQSNNADVASHKVNDIARKQVELKENSTKIIEQLIDISKKTFFVSPQMSQTMSSMMNNMNNAVENLENRNVKRAAESQKKSMGDLNQAVLSMQNSMEKLSQSSSSSGMEEFLQQMQQMSGQQGQLNQESMSLFQQQGQSGMKLSEDALARIAAQQEMIKQALENLNQQMGQKGNTLGRLGELGKEMEEVIKKLQKQQLDRKVIDRQEQILSRLLDAQKSIREKEYSKKRQAEKGKKIVVKSPPDLRKEIIDREDKLQKELIQALKEGYSPEYRDYIKLYFEILSRQSIERINN